MKDFKLVYSSLVITSIALHAGALLLILLSAGQHAEDPLVVLKVLGAFLCVLWIVVTVGAGLDRNFTQEKKSISLWFGLLSQFATVGLAILQLPFAGFALMTFCSSSFMISILYTTTMALLINGIVGLSCLIAAYMHGNIPSMIALLLLMTMILPGKFLLNRAYEEYVTKAFLFEQSKWAAGELTRVLMQLDDRMQTVEKQALLQERTRIAREVHDTVGYSLTATLVQLGVIQELVQEHAIKLRLEQLESLLRETLRDTRVTVTELREDDEGESASDWYQSWARLCSVFAECTGVKIRVNIGLELQGVDHEQGETLYRILQETLTNAYRHGQSTFVDVAMKWRADLQCILCRVSDNGIGCRHVNTGNGLQGIKERVKALHGVVEWQSMPHKGFDIGMDIPWKGVQRDGNDSSVGG